MRQKMESSEEVSALMILHSLPEELASVRRKLQNFAKPKGKINTVIMQQ